MILLIKLLGIVILVLGVIYLINPDTMKQYAAFWTKGKRMYSGAALSTLIGIMLLLAATQCAVSWVIALFGIITIVKGIVLFVLGPEKAKTRLNRLVEKPVAVLRVFAILAIVIGALLIYAA
jgi:uncharacterized protein YjeT (DUF2065 family)